MQDVCESLRGDLLRRRVVVKPQTEGIDRSANHTSKTKFNCVSSAFTANVSGRKRRLKGKGTAMNCLDRSQAGVAEVLQKHRARSQEAHSKSHANTMQPQIKCIAQVLGINVSRHILVYVECMSTAF